MTNKNRSSRRVFLKKTVTSLSAGLLALGSHRALAEKKPHRPNENTPTPETQGYHETEHIKTYYQKARF